jgi:hypothetical protein
MKCEQIQERMIDVLYGEEIDPRGGFEFFGHLGKCSGCNLEYMELLETREQLGDWKIEHQPKKAFEVDDISSGFFRRIPWWPLLQKVAAGVLIVVGAISILQSMGYLGGNRLVVSQQQLTETVQDMIVAQQAKERELMLRALLEVKEDVELRERDNFGQMQQYLVTLEQRYIENIEENNHYMRTMLSR